MSMDMEKFIRNTYGLGGKPVKQDKNGGKPTERPETTLGEDLTGKDVPVTSGSGAPESLFFSAVSPRKNSSGTESAEEKNNSFKTGNGEKNLKADRGLYAGKSGKTGNFIEKNSASKTLSGSKPETGTTENPGKVVKYTFASLSDNSGSESATGGKKSKTFHPESGAASSSGKHSNPEAFGNFDSENSSRLNPEGFYKVPQGDSGGKEGKQSFSGIGKDGFEKKEDSSFRTEDGFFTRAFSGKGSNPENYRKVAKFLVLIGEDKAAKIMSKLTPEQAEKIAWEISSIRGIDKDEASAIFAEFNALAAQAQHIPGGVRTARSILEAAFGKEKGDEILKKSVPDLEGKPFDYLSELDTKKVLLLLNNESASLIALVMTQIPPALAASVIESLQEDKRKDVIQHLAKLKKVDKEVIARIDRIMREKAKNIDSIEDESIDGRSALAEILRQMDSTNEEKILQSLNSVDSELGKDMRNRMFTIQDLIKGDKRWFEKELRNMDNRDIALLINKKPVEFRRVILDSVSKNRGSMILEEEELMKEQNLISARERESVYRNFLTKAKKARDSGDFVVEDRDFVV